MPKTLNYFFGLICLISLASCGISKMLDTRPSTPVIKVSDTLRTKVNDSFYRVGNNQLRKNQFGIWELYVEGDAYERGLAAGSLMRELMAYQEEVFMKEVLSKVPNENRIKLLTTFVNVFNRNIHEHIVDEYKNEIYGVSQFNSKVYDSLVPSYIRNLYLHSAHDIGHALQDLMNVGCTSFAVWGEKTFDNKLLIARNFDFHVNDAFNKHKIVAFVNPNEGHKFMMYTWPGFMGVVSGINEYGVTVTINAGKSKIPFSAKTPISLLAREILQYSKNTYDARRIAQSREVFVSESILVGSQIEKKAIIIELAPKSYGIYNVPNDANALVCANHFQSEPYLDDKRNIEAKFNSHSMHRFERLWELLDEKQRITPKKAINLLREKRGLQDSILGYGNERAINQLQAHHGIVFQPEDYKVYVSAPPYNLGKFIPYDIKDAFKRFEDTVMVDTTVALVNDVIAEDPFLNSQAYEDYIAYKDLYEVIKFAIESSEPVPNALLQRLILLNPYQWKAYELVGDYFYMRENYNEAAEKYQAALDLRVTSPKEYAELQEKIDQTLRKLNRWQN